MSELNIVSEGLRLAEELIRVLKWEDKNTLKDLFFTHVRTELHKRGKAVVLELERALIELAPIK